MFKAGPGCRRVRVALPERGDELLEIGHEVMVGNSRVDDQRGRPAFQGIGQSKP